MMKGLVLKPFATLSFLNLFKFIHLSGTKVHAKDIDPQTCSDDLYLMIIKDNIVYDLAIEFDKICNSDLDEKKKYKNILTKLIDFSFYVMPSAIPISRIWKSIKIGSEGELKKCFNEAKKNWPLVITLRKFPSTMEFKQALEDDRVKSLFINKWKPIHLMIYFGRLQMIDDILSFSGRSIKKVLTIENKKTLTGDEYFPLRLALRLKRNDIFKSLWNLAHQWSIMHLFQVIKDLKMPSLYMEKMFEILLTDKTTKDIIIF